MLNIDSTSAKSYLKSGHQNKEIIEILGSDIDVIVGITEDAKSELNKIGIYNVFDLAFSNIFEIARKITEEFTSTESLITWYGKVPQDLVEDKAADIPLNELHNEKIEILRSIGARIGQTFREKLGIDTIRDLAFYPAYRFAKTIFNEAAGINVGLSDNFERPSDLLPTSGKFPIEQVRYQTIVLDKIIEPGKPVTNEKEYLDAAKVILGDRVKKSDEKKLLTQFNQLIFQRKKSNAEISESGQIDISAIVKSDIGFERPALGALVTFTQSWFNIGVALGQLLHSIALAPGESTRIAMVDWNRRTKGSITDATSEQESLTNQLGSSRSISEVTSAVASELQQGKSSSVSKTSTTSESGEVGGSFGLNLFGLQIGGGGGYTRSTSEGTSNANSWGFSSGRRNMAAEMSQQVNASTHQASNLSRNRYATTVKEVSQEEHEKISTRVITNYNHMHALTIQYYEVVQIYRTDVEISKVNKCLFIPMKPIDFNNNAIFQRYKNVIASVGLTEEIRMLSQSDPSQYLIISNGVRLEYKIEESEKSILKLTIRQIIAPYFNENVVETLTIRKAEGNATATVPITVEKDTNTGLTSYSFDLYSAFNEYLTLKDIAELKLNLKLTSNDKTQQLRKVSLNDLRIVFVDTNYKTISNINIGSNTGFVTTPEYSILRIMKILDYNDLFRHLEENKLYYSQAIWNSLDIASLAYLLSPYTIGGEPILNKIDPSPIATIGNYLIFVYHEDENDGVNKQWEAFMKRTALDDRRKTSTLIPLPSGGVFGEAVLGRSNSAEKIDMTRFWNWQDSPIPIQAPEISALQAGGKATSDGLSTAQLGSASLQQMNPISMPDPTGLAAIISAIQNGNSFRDMSGLMATIGLSQAAMSKSFDATTAAGQQAGQAFGTSADILKTMYAASALNNVTQNQKPTPAMDNATKVGGMINEGEKLDKAKADIPKNELAGSSNVALPSKKAEAFDKAIGKNTEAIEAFKEVNQPIASPTDSKKKQSKIGDIPIYKNQIYDDIPLTPNEGGRSISPDALERCDILLSTTSHWDSEVIRKLTQSVISHALIHVNKGLVVEAIKSGVEQKSIEEAIAESYVVVAFRYPGLTEEQKIAIEKFLADHLGDPYDFVGAIESADFVKDHSICNLLSSEKAKTACKAFKGIVSFGKGNDTKFFCSELVLRAFQEAGIQLTKTAPQFNSPAKIENLTFKTLTYVGHLKYESVP